jgi:hypothetical protein
VESHNCLGIYLRPDRASVVCVASQGRDRRLLACFSVSAEDEQENRTQVLAARIANTCSEKDVTFGQAAVALDCAMFMQHGVHSEFNDYKRIAATVRFDTEEALATDVAEIAVAFRVLSSDDSGSNLDVFSVSHPVLTGILTALQRSGIDPITVSPDSYCLSCYLQAYAASADASDHRPMYALLSDSRGYLVTVPGPSKASTMRAFPVAPVQNREQLLAREVLTTTALAEAAGPVDRLFLFDAKREVAAELLGKRVGRTVQACDLAEIAGFEPGDLAGCPNPVDFALAYGAALTLPEKEKGINFRNDHMPYQGETIRRNKALKFLSISVTILLLTLGVLFHAQLLMQYRMRAAIREKFEPDYQAVMMVDKASVPGTVKGAVSELEKTLRHIKQEKGIDGVPQESISANLTLILQAIQSCAAQTGLKVDTINVTDKNIYLNGSTSSQGNADVVFETIKRSGLNVGANRGTSEGDRYNFDVTVELGKTTETSKAPERS